MGKWYTDKSIEYYSNVLAKILSRTDPFAQFYLCVTNIPGIKIAVLNDDIPAATLDNLASRGEFLRWVSDEMKKVFAFDDCKYYACFPEISKSFFIEGFVSLDEIVKFITENNIFSFKVIDEFSGIVFHSFPIEYYYAVFVKGKDCAGEIDFKILKEIR